jgi:hypothetical protein
MLAAMTPVAPAITHTTTTDAATAAQTPMQLPARSRSRRGSHPSRWRSVPWVYSAGPSRGAHRQRDDPHQRAGHTERIGKAVAGCQLRDRGAGRAPMPRLLEPAVAAATTVPTHSAKVPAASAPSIPGRRS